MIKSNIITRNRALAVTLFLTLALVLIIAPCSNSGPWEDDSAQPTAPPTESSPPPTPVPTPASTPMPTAVPTVVPAPTQAPADQPTPEPDPEPTSTPQPEPAYYPLEDRDMLGRPFAIEAKPIRIVSISPTATEMLYMAGGTAIARDTSSTFPDEVLDLPELGGAYSPSFEAIAAQRGDLILIEALTQSRFLEPLSQMGAPVVAVRAASLDDVIQGIKLIGRIIENSEAAEQAAQEITARVSAAVEGVEGGQSALILISDADRNLYVAKPESYPGAIASMLQLSNPASDLPDSGTFPGFAQVSAEQLLSMDPDFLFTITPAPEPAPRLSAMLPRIPGFAILQAITSGRVHELDLAIFLRNQGPRIAEAVEAMAEIVATGQ